MREYNLQSVNVYVFVYYVYMTWCGQRKWMCLSLGIFYMDSS